MPTEQIGTYHLADRPELFEVQRNCNYEFVVTGIDDLIRPGMIGNEANAKIKDAQNMLRLSVTSAFIPHFSQTPIEIKRGNNTLKYAGLPSFEAGSLTFNDFIGADVKSILMAWQNMSYSVYTEKVASLQRTPYKKQCFLLEYPPDYYAPHRKWIIGGCWISQISEDGYSNDNGDKHSVSCTIQYDWAKLDTSIIPETIQQNTLNILPI